MDAVIITNGTPEEIAALVLMIQERQEKDVEEVRRQFYDWLDSWLNSKKRIFSE